MSATRDRILSSAALQAARAARDLDALAAGLNAQGSTAVQSRFVTARTVLAECADGAGILSALDTASTTNSAVKYALSFLKQDSGLDVGHPATRAMIDSITPVVLSAAWAAELKNMALLPVIVSRADVNAAMFNDDGSEKTV